MDLLVRNHPEYLRAIVRRDWLNSVHGYQREALIELTQLEVRIERYLGKKTPPVTLRVYGRMHNFPPPIAAEGLESAECRQLPPIDITLNGR